MAGSKRYFEIGADGISALNETRQAALDMWAGLAPSEVLVMKRALPHNFEAKRAILFRMIRRPMMKRGLPVPGKIGISSPSA